MEFHMKWLTTHKFVEIIFNGSLDMNGEEYYIYSTDRSCIIFREWKEVHKTRHNMDWTCMLDLTCFTAWNRKNAPKKEKHVGLKSIMLEMHDYKRCKWTNMFWIQASHVNVYTCAHTKTHKTVEMLQYTVKDCNIQIFQPAWTVQWLFRRSTTTWASSCTIYTHNETQCALTVAQ
jgi:hypothetical protein